MAKRDINIDIAKGLGVFLVILGHNLANEKLGVGKLIYSFHMPLFFMLAGIFHKQDNGIVTLLKSKGKRLLLPFVFFSLFHYFFYLAWAFCFTGVDNFEFNIIYKIIPYKDAISIPLWFFISLFEILIIYFLVLKKINTIWLRMFVVFILSWLSYFISQMNLPFYYNYFHIFSSFSMLIFYAIGHDFFNVLKTKWLPKNNYLKVCSFFLISSLLYFINSFFKGIDINSNTFKTPFFIYITSAIMGIYALWILSNLINKTVFLSKFWAYIGKNSLGIFAIHLALFEFSRPLVNLIISKEIFLNNLMGAFITLTLAIILNTILKKVVPFVYGL
ncbi:acyltransferase family protein [Polaribacter sp. L3A8]|uniref:acyltransferase family protein n=1 Tax=Polaribacter sp. L3A8 TaxID=2686361 RepID=UPI00131E0BDA|nr:acyltransferase family protein [Polaribacter sp. L3A8]